MATNEVIDKHTSQRRVVCSACRCSETGHLIIGPRHFDDITRSQLKQSMTQKEFCLS